MATREKAPTGRSAPAGFEPGANGVEHKDPDGHGYPEVYGHPVGRGRTVGNTQAVQVRQVSEIQRGRILAAMVEVVAERGAVNVTVAHIVARSGVSRRTFYELFADREACFLAAFDDAIERIVAIVVPAYEEHSRWREKVRAGLVALLGLLDDQPALGGLVLVEALGASAGAAEHRQRVLAKLIEIVDQGRSETKQSDGPPPMAAEGIVGGVLAILHARLLATPPPSNTKNPANSPQTPLEDDLLLALTGPLMSMIVLPYLGAAAARRELQAPVPERHSRPSQTGATDPLRELDMRLTYRTVRVLTAIAELSGHGSYPSNRQVGVAADMHDQGQVSKLLARLHRLGLIQNTGLGPGKGAPNAWTLTPKGHQIQTIIRQQTG